MSRFWFLFLCGCALLASAPNVRAWGPHPAITRAALDSLGDQHPLQGRLGDYFPRLTNYCWLADYKQLPYRDAGEDFYANDYLLFPGTATHLDHICPEVKRAYTPYFRRVVQALRTEDARNAARWTGSLLHFIEDTGSPPHAAELRGPLHIKMENWVDASRIAIGGYRPALLGTNEDSALAGLLKRMDGLIAYSKTRGMKALTPVTIGHRAAVEPLALECALETARVTADLLHTLGHLAAGDAAVASLTPANAVLSGTVRNTVVSGMDRYAAKLMIEGTRFSTLAAPDGSYELRGLPPGEHRVVAMMPGAEPAREMVRLAPGATNLLDINLRGWDRAGGPGPLANLVRNAAFDVRWVSTNAPDCWYSSGLGWEGEVIPLQRGRKYRLEAAFLTNATATVQVRWTRNMPYEVPQPGNLPRVQSRSLSGTNNVLEFTGSESFAFVQATIETKQSPTTVCRRISLTAAGE